MKKRKKHASAKKTSVPAPKKAIIPSSYLAGLAIAISIAAFYWQILYGRYMMWEDAIGYHYSNVAYIVNQLREGIFPWWNPYSFGGNVLAADIQACIFYPFHWLMLIPQAIFGTSFIFLAWYIVLHLIWMARGQYAVLREFGFGRKASVFGATGLVLSGYVTGQFIHMIFILAAAWMPWAFLFFHKSLTGKKWKHVFLAGICLGMSMLGGLPQISVHFFYFLALYGIFHIAASKKYKVKAIGKTVLRMGAVFCLALGISSVIYIQTIELINYTPRQNMTYEEAVDDSLLPGRLITAFAPKFFGAVNGIYENRGYYWGKGGSWLYWESQIYLGLSVLLFAVFGFLKWRSSLRYFFLAVSVIAVIASMGKTFPLFKFIWYLVPGMKLFRVPSRFLFYLAFCFSFLSAAGIQAFWETDTNTRKKLFQAVLITGAGFFVVWLVFVTGFFSESSKAFTRKEIYQQATAEWLWQALICASLGITIFFLNRNPRSSVLFGLLAVILWADLFRAHGSFNYGSQTPQQFYPDNKLVQFFRGESRKGLFRVNARTGNRMILQKNHGMVQNVFTLQGYNPLRPLGLFRLEKSIPKERVLDLYNVKYGITVDPSGRLGLGERSTYVSRFWFADSVKIISDTSMVFSLLSAKDFPYKSKVILTKPIPDFFPTPYDSIYDRIDVGKYTSSYIKLKVKCNGPKLLIASENYFPGWKARVDGSPQKIRVADRTFWAVPIYSAGDHTIEFHYSSNAFRLGSVISLLTLVTAIAGILLVSRKKRIFNRSD